MSQHVRMLNVGSFRVISFAFALADRNIHLGGGAVAISSSPRNHLGARKWSETESERVAQSTTQRVSRIASWLGK